VRRRTPYLLLVIALLAVDLWSKDAAFTALDGYEENPAVWKHHDVIDGLFRICVVRNTGATFGLASGHGTILLVLNLIVIVILLAVFWRCRPGQWVRATSLSLILAGAFGNIYDRFRFGWVRDFLDFYVDTHHWPPFNVADACIVVGVAVLAVILWRTPAEKKSE